MKLRKRPGPNRAVEPLKENKTIRNGMSDGRDAIIRKDASWTFVAASTLL
jgi:hypothetical protein